MSSTGAFSKYAATVMFLVCLGSGFADEKVTVQLTRPAELNLTKFTKLGIGEISGERGADVGDGMMDALFKSGKFEVLDRTYLNQIQKEHNLILGTGDESAARELGKFIGASALVVGRATDVHDITNVTYKQVEYQELINGVWYRRMKNVYTRETTAFITANLRIIDATNGQVIATKTVPAQQTAKVQQDFSAPALIDPTNLYHGCREQIVEAFSRMIAPYSESVVFEFMEERKLDEMKQGLNFARVGEWTLAREAYESALKTATADKKMSKNSDTLAKVYYNIGLCALLANDIDAAELNLKRAIGLDAKKRYSEVFAVCPLRRKDIDALREQGAL